MKQNVLNSSWIDLIIRVDYGIITDRVGILGVEVSYMSKVTKGINDLQTKNPDYL